MCAYDCEETNQNRFAYLKKSSKRTRDEHDKKEVIRMDEMTTAELNQYLENIAKLIENDRRGRCLCRTDCT